MAASLLHFFALGIAKLFEMISNMESMNSKEEVPITNLQASPAKERLLELQEKEKSKQNRLASLTLVFLTYLNTRDLVTMMSVNREWRNIIIDAPYVFENIMVKSVLFDDAAATRILGLAGKNLRKIVIQSPLVTVGSLLFDNYHEYTKLDFVDLRDCTQVTGTLLAYIPQSVKEMKLANTNLSAEELESFITAHPDVKIDVYVCAECSCIESITVCCNSECCPAFQGICLSCMRDESVECDDCHKIFCDSCSLGQGYSNGKPFMFCSLCNARSCFDCKNESQPFMLCDRCSDMYALL